MPPLPDGLTLDPRDGFIEARFTGTFSVPWFNRLVDASFSACRERKLGRLLVDVNGVLGELSTFDRYEIASHAAKDATDLRIAMLAPPSLIDAKKFGLLVAQNRGLDIEIFTERPAAVDWLLR